MNAEELFRTIGVPAVVVGVIAALVWSVNQVQTLARPIRWIVDRIRTRQTPTPERSNVGPWERHIHRRMEQLWVHGKRAPLRAAELESTTALLYVEAKTVQELLHPSRRTAMSLPSGQSIQLDEDLSPADVFTLLDYSVLITGAPGAGKSVFLWQLLRDLLNSAESAVVGVPVIIELHRWQSFDSGGSVEPHFDDFVVAELASTSVGLPPGVAEELLARNRLILLLDGLDEVPVEARSRCMTALSRFAAGPGASPRRSLAVTCRLEEYREVAEQRGSGTAAVRNAVQINPLSSTAIENAFSRADPPLGMLPATAGRLPALNRMLGRPLWLTVAATVYRARPMADPLAELSTDANEGDVAGVLYPQWLNMSFCALTEIYRDRARVSLGYIAAALQRSSRQILYLEQVQPDWLPQRERIVAQVLASVVAGVAVAGICGLLVGVGSGLFIEIWGGLDDLSFVDGIAYGATVGVFAGIVGALLSYPAFRSPAIVARREWSWRAVLRRDRLAAGVRVGLPVALFFFVFAGLSTTLSTIGHWRALTDIGRQFSLQNWLDELSFALAAGFVTGSIAFLVVGPARGGWLPEPSVSGRAPEARAVLRASTVNGIVMGAGAFALGGSLAFLIGALTFLTVLGSWSPFSPVQDVGLRQALTEAAGGGVFFGLVTGLISAVYVGLRAGLAAPIGYISTTVVGAMFGLVPRRLVTFLEECSDVGILYRAGPGYRFRHRTLTEYIAHQYRASSNVRGRADAYGPTDSAATSAHTSWHSRLRLHGLDGVGRYSLVAGLGGLAAVLITLPGLLTYDVVYSVLSDDGAMLAVAWDDQRIEVRTTSRPSHAQVLRVPTPVWHMEFNDDANELAIVDNDSLTLWHVASERQDRINLRRLAGESDSIVGFDRALDVAAVHSGSRPDSPDNYDVTLRTTATGEVVQTLPNVVESVDFTLFGCNGERVITIGGDEGTVVVWNVRSGTREVEWEVGEWVSDATMDCSGKRLATTDDRGSLILWDVETGHELRAWQSDEYLYGVAVDSEGALVASLSNAGVSVRNATSGEVIYISGDHRDYRDLAFDRVGERVATVASDGSFRWHDL